MRNGETHWPSRADILSRQRVLPDHRVLRLERAGVARESGDPQSDLFDHRARFSDAAAVEIGYLHRRRSLAEDDVDGSGKLDLCPGRWR